MELDEAIAHAEEVAELNENMAHLDPESPELDQSCLKCAAEHRQLAAWLRELKAIKIDNWLKTHNEITMNKSEGYKDNPDMCLKSIGAGVCPKDCLRCAWSAIGKDRQ